MLKILVRCKQVDRYGFQGRNLHPDQSHVGRVFEVVSIGEGLLTPDGHAEEPRDLDQSEPIVREEYGVCREAALDLEEGYIYKYMLCTDGQGNWVTFIDSEVEVVDVSNQ